jgi:hypothetical protein
MKKEARAEENDDGNEPKNKMLLIHPQAVCSRMWRRGRRKRELRVQPAAQLTQARRIRGRNSCFANAFIISTCVPTEFSTIVYTYF